MLRKINIGLVRTIATRELSKMSMVYFHRTNATLGNCVLKAETIHN